MKKHLLIVSALALVFCLFACSESTTVTNTSTGPHNHDWSLATCATPRICKICGEKKDVFVPHWFTPATCQAPETCHTCGLTQGEIIDHKMTPATCQSPKKCMYCDLTQGELGDHEIMPATCQSPEKCKYCELTQGDIGSHNYAPATCLKPETCKTCGLTNGSALGHDYESATCQEPETCKNCGVTTGSSVSHDYMPATCQEPKTCRFCGKTTGYRASHEYNDATCTTPKTCKHCGTTSGYASGHTYKFATCTTPETCKTCGATNGVPYGHSYSSKGICFSCNQPAPREAFSLGQKWVVDGMFELTINSVTPHYLCDSSYSNSSGNNGATTAVLVEFTYKNLGVESLDFGYMDIRAYDANGTEADAMFFGEIYCNHGRASLECLSGGSCTAILPVALVNSGSKITIYIDKRISSTYYRASFTCNVTGSNPDSGELPSGAWNYSDAVKLDNYVNNAIDYLDQAKTAYNQGQLYYTLANSYGLLAAQQINDAINFLKTMSEITFTDGSTMLERFETAYAVIGQMVGITVTTDNVNQYTDTIRDVCYDGAFEASLLRVSTTKLLSAF